MRKKIAMGLQADLDWAKTTVPACSIQPPKEGKNASCFSGCSANQRAEVTTQSEKDGGGSFKETTAQN